MRPKGYINSQLASVLMVILFGIGILLGIGLERTKDHELGLVEKESSQFGPAIVTFQDHVVEVGTTIENINTGKPGTVTDIVESFGGSVVYVLDIEGEKDRWSESLIKKWWREAPKEREK
jgi:hypothetical protein